MTNYKKELLVGVGMYLTTCVVGVTNFVLNKY